MPNKELDKMTEKIDSICADFGAEVIAMCGIIPSTLEGKRLPELRAGARKEILAKKTSNGYSIQEMIEFFGKIKRNIQREAVVKRKAKLLDSGILTLWDSYTQDMERLYDLLMQGKSELAAVILQERKTIHNGQSRETLIDMLAKHFMEEVVDD